MRRSRQASGACGRPVGAVRERRRRGGRWLAAAAVVLVADAALVSDTDRWAHYLPGRDWSTPAASAEEIAERLGPYDSSQPALGLSYPRREGVLCGEYRTVWFETPQGVPAYFATLPSYRSGTPVEGAFWVMPDADAAAAYLDSISDAAHRNCVWEGRSSLGDTVVRSRISVSAYQRGGWTAVRTVDAGHTNRHEVFSKPFTTVWVFAAKGVTVAAIKWHVSGFAGPPDPSWPRVGQKAADRVLRVLGGRPDAPPPTVRDEGKRVSVLASHLPAADAYAQLLAPPGPQPWRGECFAQDTREDLPPRVPLITRVLQGRGEIVQIAALFPDEAAAERYRQGAVVPSRATHGPCIKADEAGLGAVPDSLRPVSRGQWRGDIQTWAGTLRSSSGKANAIANGVLAVRSGTAVVYLRLQVPTDGQPRRALAPLLVLLDRALSQLPQR
jgi:hypothetical protein